MKLTHDSGLALAVTEERSDTRITAWWHGTVIAPGGAVIWSEVFGAEGYAIEKSVAALHLISLGWTAREEATK